MKIADIGEQGLLKKLQRFCPSEIVGDDAAVLETVPNTSLVVTTDVLIDGVHFSDRTTSAEDAGWRAAAANLSDLAAMGASPVGITVGLGLRGDVSVTWVEDLYRGLTQCLQIYKTPIVGGDIVRSPVISIAITAFGRVRKSQTIYRNQARVGDAIVVTGIHGAASAGLELLLDPQKGENLTESERAALIEAHQRPQPRLDVLPVLWDILNSQDSEFASPRVAGMDSSDGLADAIFQICRASNVGAAIERNRIILHPAMKKLLGKAAQIESALYGGEDFQLVLCLPKESAVKLVQILDANAAIIGTITADSTVLLTDETGKFKEKLLSLKQSFQHF
ncbi:MAG: thiamine-phosphate kinase [Mastigocoleus sp. MO_167.B18]|nr:thiamine-phosphate kinase [Mastigocoleus sp. MO_167.B18]